MKAHLFKRFENGMLSTTRSECGQSTSMHAQVWMYKTKSFKEIMLSDRNEVCSKCLAKAIETGRIKL